MTVSNTRTQPKHTLRVVAAVLAVGLALGGGTAIAQSRLSIGGSQSNFGSRTLSGGFMPDPSTVSIVSGGNLDARSMGLGPGCLGNVTRQPDFILNYQNAAGFLRFFAESSGDVTLIVNDAQGNWHCNDDSNGGLNPMVDIRNPPSGQYDVWVGSYQSDQNLRSTLSITELRSQHP